MDDRTFWTLATIGGLCFVGIGASMIVFGINEVVGLLALGWGTYLAAAAWREVQK